MPPLVKPTQISKRPSRLPAGRVRHCVALAMVVVALAGHPGARAMEPEVSPSPLSQIAMRQPDDVLSRPPVDLQTPDGDTARVIVRAFETAAISSEVNARITFLPPREGDAFRKGDVIVEFDCRRTIAERDAAQASAAGLSAAYQSQLRLLEYKSAGTASVDQARYQLEKAQAELRLTSVRLESCRILAPFDGRVSEKLAHIHEIAQPNQPLIKIINETRVELLMMVPSAWISKIAGAEFPVAIDETKSVHRARVLQTTGLIDPISQSVRVIAEFVEPVPGVLPGMSGLATLRHEESLR